MSALCADFRVIVEATHKVWKKDVHLIFYARAKNDTEAQDMVERKFDFSALESIRYTIEPARLADVWQASGDLLAVPKQ